ncbi:MAG: tRNA preQ1(34) S-adenosylmethionine ribosyltransferase-isomerase QueA [Desulfovibrionales bacterium]
MTAAESLEGEDLLLTAYDYDIAPESIAQHPADRRETSRLLILDRSSGRVQDARFDALADFLPKGSLLVANNSMVLPARVFGQRETGGRVEFLLLTPLPLVLSGAENVAGGGLKAEVQGLVRASKGPRQGETVQFTEEFSFTVQERGEFGRVRGTVNWKGDLAEKFQQHGQVPLPPYIKRPDTAGDRDRYQTVYADRKRLGSVAAPTAGLHFTSELREELKRRGIGWCEVTLYVGYGTFSPIRNENIDEHRMHREYVEISQTAAEAINRARAESRPVVAVGTTSVRTLEGVYAELGEIAPWSGWTDIYIRPGFRFRVTDHMITNFHLPKSSLLVMVSAFAGRERILSSYRHALKQGYRFFSYGDSMLIL